MENVVLNIVGGMQKERKPEARSTGVGQLVDPDDVYRFYEVRGRVVSMTTDGGDESIDEISQKYLSIPTLLQWQPRRSAGDRHDRGRQGQPARCGLIHTERIGTDAVRAPDAVGSLA